MAILKKSCIGGLCTAHEMPCKCLNERIIHNNGSRCTGRKMTINGKEYTIVPTI